MTRVRVMLVIRGPMARARAALIRVQSMMVVMIQVQAMPVDLIQVVQGQVVMTLLSIRMETS